jgi:hypothetical protein
MARKRHGNGMVCVNQTRPHCVIQMGKTQSKAFAARHGRGTAEERHGMCKSAFMLLLTGESVAPSSICRTVSPSTSLKPSFCGTFNVTTNCVSAGAPRKCAVRFTAVAFQMTELPLGSNARHSVTDHALIVKNPASVNARLRVSVIVWYRMPFVSTCVYYYFCITSFSL